MGTQQIRSPGSRCTVSIKFVARSVRWMGLWAMILGTAFVAGAQNSDLRDGVGGDSVPVVVPDVPEEDIYNPALLDRTLENNRLVEGRIRAETENELRDARARMTANPQSVQESLKLALERVRKAPELSAEVRAQLQGQLETALRESARRSVEKDQRDIEFEQTQAQAEERLRITQALERRQERLRQLMDRFDSLMAEGRYLLAEETAAYEVQKLAPNDPISVSAAKVSAMTRHVQDMAMVRLARQKGYVDAMYQVELAFVPFPDDQVIVYPDAQMWEEMGALRKKWKDYASVDLKDQEGPTAKIRKALDEETSFEFTELPLDQVVQYLKDKHGIEIQLDTKVLEEASIGVDTPVTRSLSGVTLRSALRLMLGALDLTY
ncbi:MAG TPA: hypothetical protein VMF30_14930, partial [Pirellulales bacterium]|nr:hypothetical protein [Pirellulales bacterium]